MFDDDNIKNPGNIPGNLPIGEPADIFAGTDDTGVVPAQPPAEPVAAPQTALGAGVLRPKNVPEPAMSPAESGVPPVTPDLPPVPQMPVTPARPDVVSQLPPEQRPPTITGQPPMTTPPSGMQGQIKNDITEPLGSRRVMMWIILSVIVVVLGVGSVWIYFSVIRVDIGQDFFVPEPDQPIEQEIVVPDTTPEEPVVEIPDEPVTTTPESPFDVDQQILLGEPLDTDGDGLDDVREADIKTDPLNWDTDGDELGDGDEVTIWKTDPLNADTDGDTYPDGAEIRNGYSPTGPGKLFEPPSPTSSEQEAI